MYAALTTTDPPEAEPRSGSLVLHKEVSDPRATGACQRFPENMAIVNEHGERVPGACGCSNQCDYCAKRAAIENTEVLWMDALLGVAPTIYACLTTRSTDPNPRAYYRSREQVQRALRRRWPELEVAWLLEFTTGYGVRSGGRRRPHWNALIKGIPDEDLDQARDVIRSVWCSREDALPAHQEVSLIRDAGGLVAYLAQHFQKESQRPPAGWHGIRFTKTRGYLWTGTADAREQARRSLAVKRAIWRVERDTRDLDLDASEVNDLAEAMVARGEQQTWSCVELYPSGGAPWRRPITSEKDPRLTARRARRRELERGRTRPEEDAKRL